MLPTAQILEKSDYSDEVFQELTKEIAKILQKVTYPMFVLISGIKDVFLLTSGEIYSIFHSHWYVLLICFEPQNFDISEPENGKQDAMFEHLSLVSDMALEYEQASIMQALLSTAPQILVGSEVVRLSLMSHF